LGGEGEVVGKQGSGRCEEAGGEVSEQGERHWSLWAQWEEDTGEEGEDASRKLSE